MMRMRRSVLLALFLAVAVSATAAAVLESSDDSSALICSDVRVYILDEDGGYTLSTVGDVQTVKAAVTKAMEDQGRTMKLNNTMTNIVSVDGRSPSGDSEFWRVFQWLPAGTSGWGVQAFNASSDEKMASGTTYCVTLSSMSHVNGSIVYSVPDFEPKSTGYVFIRFANGYSPDNEHVKSVFTSEIREQGFWLKGEGSNLGEVLTDAIESNWPGEISTYTGDAGGGTDVSSWIDKLFGLGNENLGDSVWAYWSQWTWVDHKWTYNKWTLGYYDPAVYPYLECIYLISTPDPYSGEYVIDKGGSEPDPDAGPVACMKNILTVDFRLRDGTLWYTQTVKYGQQVDTSAVPEPMAEGKGFTGWGDTTKAVTEDTVFTASFVDVSDGMKCITYNTEAGQMICKEYVLPGSAARYAGVPTKISTKQYDYVFSGWSSDLSSVENDITVTPVFTPKVRSYEVRFYDYDRTFISSSMTEYGSAAVLPPEPSRESTVRYQYVFAGWSITPNNNVSADLDNITGTLYVFAYYEPEAREYTLTFWEGGQIAGTYPAKYGSPLGETYPMDLFRGEAMAKMYRDADLTQEYSTSYIVTGDTAVYVSRIAGSYDAERASDGTVTGDTVQVSFTETLARSVTVRDGTAVICDISQYPNGTVGSLDRASLQILSDVLGGDCRSVISVPRGSVSMTLSEFLKVLGDGDELSFSVGNGPSGIKITSALKKINYDAFYRLNLKSDSLSVMDLGEYGISADVTLALSLDEGLSAAVWNIRASGATSYIAPSYDGSYASFSTDLLQFYAVGTTDDAAVKRAVVNPGGECEYSVDGTGMNGHATLTSITLDNMGDILFLPSSYGGTTLRTVSSGALNGVVDAPAVVVPMTVTAFSWNSWTNTAIRDVYFLGDSPLFEGTVPDGVTVHHSPDASGWTVGTDDLEFYKYAGSYRKDVFSFNYYIVGNSAVIHRYTSGTYIQVPDYISVNGTSYPVEYIGDGAFMFSDDSSVAAAYGLKYSAYYLETVELSSSVKEIQCRSFYGSPIVNLYSADSLVRIYDEAFRGCTALSNVTFPDGLLYIGYAAFAGCSGQAFTRVTVPDSVKEIGANAFFDCASITNVTLGNGISSIPEYCFGNCGKLSELEFPDSVKSIGDSAFYNCAGLSYVNLNCVETVGKDAFYSALGPSAMEFAVFGSALKSIGAYAFGNCSNITELEVHCMFFSTFEDAFFNVDLSGIKVYADSDIDGVMDSWSDYNPEPINPADIEQDDTLLRTVEVGLIVFFLAVGVFSFYRKMRAPVSEEVPIGGSRHRSLLDEIEDEDDG